MKRAGGKTVVVCSSALSVCRSQSGNTMLKLLWTLSVDRIGGTSVYHSFDAPDFR